MHPNSLENLKKGENWGNAGGGGQTPVKVRETKKAWLDSILEARKTIKAADGETEVEIVVGHELKQNIITDVLNPSIKGAPMRMWLSEMMHGKPQSKIEYMIGNDELATALVYALSEAGVEAEQARTVVEIFGAHLAASSE